MDYQTPRNTRRESRTLTGRFRGGKLNPVMATAIRPSEGGMLSQNITLELDPIMGRMITPITGELVSVFVPVQAMDAIVDPEASYAGMTEVVREKLLSGNPLFGVQTENEISMRCGIVPKRVGGSAQVSTAVRYAHNAAVNYLRQRKYDKAPLVAHSNGGITPAIIGQTVLDRLNGVLDPDDHINGTVNLDLPTMQLPVQGIGFETGTQTVTTQLIRETDVNRTKTVTDFAGLTNATNGGVVAVSGTSGNYRPDVFATFNGTVGGNVSLVDFYAAEKMDQLTRVMGQMLQENPQFGEEMVLRWAHGLSVDAGKVPFVIAEKTAIFGRSLVGATDATGIEADVMRSDMMLQLSFSVPVPKTELGGIVVTFAVLKPDETLAAQPHPFLSEPWGLDKYVADELALAPVPVTIRELDGDCASGDESTVAMYTGLNALKQAYVNYGFSRQLDPLTVEAKTAIWQLEIPVSVTPENILYPATLSHYPFADQNAEVCTYTISSNLVCQTPIIFGPSPVEKLPVILDNDLFEEN